MRLTLLLMLLFIAACGGPSSVSEPSGVQPQLVGAAREGRATEIGGLVGLGANPNGESGVNHWTVLMHAIHKNQFASVKALLDLGADPNRRSSDQPSALMMAAGYGQLDVVRLLLERGADPYASYRGETALDWAVGGTTDIDDFTLFRCQSGTVRAILLRAPDLATAAFRARNRLKLAVCPDVRTAVSSRGKG